MDELRAFTADPDTEPATRPGTLTIECRALLEVSEYRYHHGHYDGVEREFCGFGFTEQVDTEAFWTGRGGGLFPEARPRNGEMRQPPVLTKTWFLTGAWGPDEKIRKRREQEVYGLDPEAPRPPEAVLPEGLSAEERRQARWALKGQRLRQEIYALDGSPAQAHPYSVVESGFSVRRVQAAGERRPGVALTPGQIARTFNAAEERVTPSILAEGGYVQLPDDSGWWMPSGREVVDPGRFYLASAVLDPFGARTAIEHDPYAPLSFDVPV